jgi:TRAP-type C4-dicarboxylate transport system substrate-binding protein
MKKIIMAVLAVALAAGLYAADAKYTIKFASVAPDGSTWMNVMNEFNDEVVEKTGGEVKFKFYPGQVMGDENDVLREMKINQVHAGGFTSQGLGDVVKEVRLLNLPLLFKDYNDIDYVMTKMAPFFEKEFSKKGFTVLGWPEVGFVYIYTKQKIETIDEFKKVKMWIWGDDILVNTLFKNIGIVPIPLSLMDVLQSLQTGLIEGVYCSPLSCIALQWNTKIKYLIDMKIANVPGGILITNKMWNSMPDRDRAIIKAAAKKYFDRLTKLSRKENEDALAVLKKQGVVFSEIKDPKDIKTFEDVSVKSAKDLVGKFYTQAQLDELMKYLAEAKKVKK